MTTTKFGSFITKEQRGRIALVRFDRGDGRNAMSREVMRQLIAVAASFDEDGETISDRADRRPALVLRGI